MNFTVIGIGIICAGVLGVVISVYVSIARKSPSRKSTKDQIIGVTQEFDMDGPIQSQPVLEIGMESLNADDVMKPLNDILSRWLGRKWVNDGSGYDIDPYQTALDGCIMDLSAAMEKIELILTGER